MLKGRFNFFGFYLIYQNWKFQSNFLRSKRNANLIKLFDFHPLAGSATAINHRSFSSASIYENMKHITHKCRFVFDFSYFICFYDHHLFFFWKHLQEKSIIFKPDHWMPRNVSSALDLWNHLHECRWLTPFLVKNIFYPFCIFFSFLLFRENFRNVTWRLRRSANIKATEVELGSVQHESRWLFSPHVPLTASAVLRSWRLSARSRKSGSSKRFLLLAAGRFVGPAHLQSVQRHAIDTGQLESIPEAR